MTKIINSTPQLLPFNHSALVDPEEILLPTEAERQLEERFPIAFFPLSESAKEWLTAKQIDLIDEHYLDDLALERINFLIYQGLDQLGLYSLTNLQHFNVILELQKVKPINWPQISLRIATLKLTPDNLATCKKLKLLKGVKEPKKPERSPTNQSFEGLIKDNRPKSPLIVFDEADLQKNRELNSQLTRAVNQLLSKNKLKKFQKWLWRKKGLDLNSPNVNIIGKFLVYYNPTKCLIRLEKLMKEFAKSKRY